MTASTTLLEDLKQRTQDIIARIEPLLALPDALLNHQAQPGSWSALECLEHLNRYGDFYLPEIDRQITNSKYPATAHFKTGWLGNWFAESVADKPQLNTMSSPKNMNPTGSQVDRSVVATFLNQQKQLLQLLDRAASVNLTKTKTSISLTQWIRLRLGDTFRVLIYHNQRHVSQAIRAIRAAEGVSANAQAT